VRFALITPRYGAEITHGAEHACRLLAEEIAERHDVDVLTTCARDPETWKNAYSEGADRIRGVLVRRFAASGGRDTPAFEALSKRLFTTAHSRSDELEWVRRSGTSSAGLVDFLRRQHRNYDALVFFSYAAGTTIHGITVAPERSVLFPGATLHPALRLSLCQDTLTAPAAIGYGSPVERRVVRTYVRRHPRAEEIVGVGIGAVRESRYPRLDESPADGDPDAEGSAESAEPELPPSHLAGRGVLFRRRHRLHGRFALYGGAVASDNGSEELIEYFYSFAERDADTSLLLLGVKMMKLPVEPWLRSAGLLPDRDRLAALEAADVALAPDPDDIIAEHTLDGMAAGTAVLASARNPAAVDHVRRSNAGLYYGNRHEFVEAMRLLTSNDRLREALGRNGRRYVQQHYRWDAVLGRFERLVGKIKGSGPRV
jgi:glycosyltransferase involved in cell wall biosynthesis